MKTTKLSRSIFISLLALTLVNQNALSQDSHTSVKINIRNVTMGMDRKTISYDIYLQDIDATNPIAIPGYIFRAIVPQADLGTGTKNVTVTNASSELGADIVTMSISANNWLMKFTNAKMIQSYNSALLLSEDFPGTRIGTFNITNADGTLFENPQVFNIAYGGTSPIVKTTISIFMPNSTILATNASSAVPAENFSGFGSYKMTTNSNGTTTPIGSPTTRDKAVKMVNVFDMTGKKVLTQRVEEGSAINTSNLPNGLYIVDDNGTMSKLLIK